MKGRKKKAVPELGRNIEAAWARLWLLNLGGNRVDRRVDNAKENNNLVKPNVCEERIRQYLLGTTHWSRLKWSCSEINFWGFLV